MNTTTYPKSKVSTLATKMQERPKHPIREEIERHLGSFDMTAVFEEDIQSASLYKNPGVIAYVCTLKQGDRVIGQGRGITVLSSENKYLGRNVKFAFTSALTDAIVRASKFPDMFAINGDSMPTFGLSPEVFLATPKQKDFLKELIDMNVADDEERNHLLSNLSSMSKEDASELIQQLKN